MDHPLIKNLISYLLIASFFITGAPVTSIGFDFYWYYVLYLCFIIYGTLVYHRLNYKVLLVLSVILIYSLLTYNHGLNLVLKQLTNIAFSTLVFYNLILFEKHDYLEVFRKFIQFSKVVLIIGFIQVALFSMGYGDLFLSCFPFLKTSAISTRFQSLSQEPSYIALLFAPIVFLSLYNLSHHRALVITRPWSIMFLLGYLLTFSSVALIGLIIIIFTLHFKSFTLRKIVSGVILVSTMIFLSILTYLSIRDIQVRVHDTAYGLVAGLEKDQMYREVNLSAYALLSNAYVTRESLRNDFFTGTGLGTHELAYEYYLPVKMKEYSSLNKFDANSMGLRLLTETGVIGFFVFCFFVFKYKLRYKSDFSSDEKILWIINSGIFVMIMLVLLRNGNYTVHGRILFFMLYYFTFHSVKGMRKFGAEVVSGK